MLYGHAPNFSMKQKQNGESLGAFKEMNTMVMYKQKVWVYVRQRELAVEPHMLTRFSKHS